MQGLQNNSADRGGTITRARWGILIQCIVRRRGWVQNQSAAKSSRSQKAFFVKRVSELDHCSRIESSVQSRNGDEFALPAAPPPNRDCSAFQ